MTMSAMRRWMSERLGDAAAAARRGSRRCIASLRSRPAQNARPAPRSTTTRVATASCERREIVVERIDQPVVEGIERGPGD